MSKLQELLRQKQRDELNPAVEQRILTSGPSLRVISSEGDFWGMPWAHFIYVRTVLCEQEVMSVVFVSHEIVVFGERLILITEGICEQRIKELRPSIARYKSQDTPTSWIKTIEVLTRKE